MEDRISELEYLNQNMQSKEKPGKQDWEHMGLI